MPKPPPRGGLLSAHHPGWSEWLGQQAGSALSGLLGSERAGANFGHKVRGLLDVTPVGALDAFASAPNTPGGDLQRGLAVMLPGPARKGAGAAFDLAGEGYRVAKIGPTQVEYAVRDGMAEISKVLTDKAARGAGAARAALEQLTGEADAAGVRLALTADPLERGVSKSRLEGFYRSLGFAPNRGRSKDFSTRAGMIREPRK